MAKKMKQEVVEYEFTSKGFGKVSSKQKDDAVNISSSQIQLNNQDTAKVQFLKTNPFMYNSKTSAYQISSLEEFLVKVRKEDYALGDIARNPEFSKSKKRRLVKKAFKDWDKEYSTQKKNVFKESDKTIEVIGDVNFMNIQFGTKLLIVGLFLLMIFVISLDSYIWNKISQGNFGFRIHQSLMDLFNATSWLKLVANITVYILVLFIFYATIYSMVSMDFVKDHKLAVDYLKKSEKTINRDYKKKFQKARSYYLRIITSKKRYNPPYDIKNVEEGHVNITTFDNIRKVAIDRAYTLKKRRPLYVGLKNIFLFLSVGGSLTVIGYALFKVVISLF
ncbi:MAG: hypothetical protein AB7V00_01425 [Bacilli bacterium]